MNKNFMGRLLAGFANSLLTGNVYMAECAPSHLVPSLKQIEVMSFDVFSFKVFLFFAVTLDISIQAASRSMGAILIFAFYVLFQRFGFRYVVIAGGLLPALAFLGTLCLQESPIFAQRLILLDHYEDDLLKLTLQDRGN